MGEITDYVNLYIEDLNLLEETTNDIAMDLQRNIKHEAPYLEGRLRRSIRVDTRIYATYSIVTGFWDEGLAPHGIHVLAGTKPHEIHAKDAKALETPYGYFKKVNHPGTKPNDFLGRGLEQTLEAYR